MRPTRTRSADVVVVALDMAALKSARRAEGLDAAATASRADA
jgi:hypothetical protein